MSGPIEDLGAKECKVHRLGHVPRGLGGRKL